MADERVFASFVAAHSRSLYGTAFLLTGNRDAAEDLLQETLTRLYPKWDAVAAADFPLAYVRRAMTNRFISSTRLSSFRDVPTWELPDSIADVDVAGSVTNRRVLWELMHDLPERQRAALVLRYFHDLPDAEIASSLGCREVTVRSLISRGVAAMRERAMQGGDPR